MLVLHLRVTEPTTESEALPAQVLVNFASQVRITFLNMRSEPSRFCVQV